MKQLLLITIAFVHFLHPLHGQYDKIFDFERAVTGGYPYDAVISDGTYLYGTTHLGGVSDAGTIFKIKPDGSGFAKILDFNDATTGSIPNGSFYYDGAYLYGTAQYGGASNKGTLFKIKPDGSDFVKLFDFSGLDGWNPSGSLVSDGVFLYGVTKMGGTHGDGTLFRIKPDGSGFSTLLHFFAAGSGFSPNGPLATDGVYLYGMTRSGGITYSTFNGGDGTLFKIKTDGTGYVKLLDFTGVNGSFASGALISDGTFLYGMTRQGGIFGEGNIFKIRPDGTGFTNLLNFDGPLNGAVPEGSLISDGTFLYGMTWGGGASNLGTLFKIKPDGSAFEKLWEFTNATEGRNPYGTLFSDGAFLYGMTYSGGINNHGAMFKFGYTPNVGTTEHLENEPVEISPNPANDHLYIKAPPKSTLEILDINGRILETIRPVAEMTALSTSALNSGMYIIRVNCDGRMVVKQWIKP